jgi:protocatechuate 3,4-dioxygenase beta subunit
MSLDHDPNRDLSRRRALGLLGGAGLAVLVGCGSDSDEGSATGSSTSTTAGASDTTTDGSASCDVVPEETAGPFPGDGSNGPNVLSQEGVVRSDIRSSFGSMSGTAEGIPLAINLTLQDGGNGCAPLAGAAVYVWHCDRDGVYSMYDSATEQNYLRGVQETNGSGQVTFTSIFPGCYSGRWPHVHFEVYSSVEEATGGGSPIATSQLAFPQGASREAYLEEGYESSITNFERLTLEGDMVFADGSDQQLATVEGSPDSGYSALLTLAVAS